MTQIAALPTLSVYIAFDPTSSGNSLYTAQNVAITNSYWTNVTQYVRDFLTKSGRQHFLERIESSLLSMTVNNRSGFFSSGSTVIGPRMPITVTASWAQTSATSLTVSTGSKTFTTASGLGSILGYTVSLSNGSNLMTGTCTAYNSSTGSMTVNVTTISGSGTFSSWSVSITYPIYYGIIDSISERVSDILNLDLTISASDLTKYLSLRYMNSPQFWSTYAQSTSAIHWYDCNANKKANVVSAVATTTVVTYYYAAGTAVVFSIGDKVTITGLTMQTGAPYNQTNVVVTGVGTGYFTTANEVTKRTGTPGGPIGPAGNSLGQAVATETIMPDLIGSTNAELFGYGVFTNNGAIIYETNTAIDLSNGSTTNSNAYIKVPTFTNLGGVDFWINGAGLAANLNVILNLTGDGTSDSFLHQLSMNDNGTIMLRSGPNALTTRTVSSANAVNDGYWHHVGIICDETGVPQLYCDGVFYSITGGYAGNGPLTNAFQNIGEGVATFIDEIIFSNASNFSSLAGEVQRRYRAGSLLQTGFPVNNYYFSSGTRIAEILCISGFGLITGGSSTAESVMTLSCGYYINDSPTPWVRYAAGNGYTYTEPYYWDSPVTGSTALDLILQVCDTDIGIFYQEPNGTFSYYNQLYYGYWSWTSSTTSLTVGTGMKTLIIPAGIPFTPGSSVTLTNQLSLMTGTVITYASGPGSNYTLIVNITNSNGTGTQSLWNVGSWALNNTYTPAPNANHTWTDTGTNVPYFAPTLQIVRDDVDVWTTVKVTPQSGTEQIFENTISENRWGYTTLTKSGTLHTSLNSALSTATYLGNLFQSPLPRVQNVELRAESYNGTYIPAILGSEIGDIVNFQRNPSGASADGSINSNFVIESISHEFQADPGTWHTSYILDPYPL